MMSFSTVESELISCDVSKEQFWKGLNVWIKSPHVENRRLCGVKTIFSRKVVEPANSQEIVEKLIAATEKDTTTSSDDSTFVAAILEDCGFKLYGIDSDILRNEKPDDQSIWIKIRKLIPKNKNIYQACLEAIILDGSKLQASFVHLGHTKDSLSPRTPYCCSLVQHPKGSTIEFGVLLNNSAPEEGAESWLRKKLFPRLVKWIVLDHSPSSEIPDSSLCLVELNEYNEKYQELKKKYGPEMVKIWPEQTDPLKFVYEDLAIASYLLCLWQCQDGEYKPSFIDLGCGNGLLVHILSSEGHPGLGLDVRSRKLWSLYPETTKLQICSVIPSLETTFPEYDWIIGNHSDELTPWIPVMATLSTPQTNFFVLPCCPFDFWGKYQRKNPSTSQYTEYIKFVRTVGEQCGFVVEIDKLRIPSTKRTCLIGRKKYKNVEKNVLWEYVTSRRQIGQDDFNPRPATELVRNCTKLPAGVASTVVKLVADKLLTVETEDRWSSELPLSEAAALLSSALRSQLKSECGGLQTLLRNHHNIFLVQGGVIKFRQPISSICTDGKRWKNRPCWFFVNHPLGCPLKEDQCSYDHTVTT